MITTSERRKQTQKRRKTFPRPLIRRCVSKPALDVGLSLIEQNRNKKNCSSTQILIKRVEGRNVKFYSANSRLNGLRDWKVHFASGTTLLESWYLIKSSLKTPRDTSKLLDSQWLPRERAEKTLAQRLPRINLRRVHYCRNFERFFLARASSTFFHALPPFPRKEQSEQLLIPN